MTLVLGHGTAEPEEDERIKCSEPEAFAEVNRVPCGDPHAFSGSVRLDPTGWHLKRVSNHLRRNVDP